MVLRYLARPLYVDNKVYITSKTLTPSPYKRLQNLCQMCLHRKGFGRDETVCLMPGQRCGRWFNIKFTVGQRLVFF